MPYVTLGVWRTDDDDDDDGDDDDDNDDDDDDDDDTMMMMMLWWWWWLRQFTPFHVAFITRRRSQAVLALFSKLLVVIAKLWPA